MIDYQKIIDNLKDDKVIEMMKRLGADEYIEKENEIIFPTICHNINADDASMKLYYYKNNHFFYCYTECGGQSIFRFLEHYYESHQIDYNWYRDVLLVAQSCAGNVDFDYKFVESYKSIADEYAKKTYIKELPEYSEKVLDTFVKKYPVEWLNDGITRAAMDKFNIKYSISQNKIIIPHYDINNRLVGIRGRALNQWEIDNVGKYMPVQIENRWYSHQLSLNLYGLNLTKENIKKYGYVYVFEAEKSVMQLEGFNMPNCGVAVCGSNFHIFHLHLLLKYCQPKEIIICFDNEEHDREDSYFFKLWNMCKKYSNYTSLSFVYDRKHLTDLKDSPTDKGEEVFKKLLESRVKVL